MSTGKPRDSFGTPTQKRRQPPPPPPEKLPPLEEEDDDFLEDDEDLDAEEVPQTSVVRSTYRALLRGIKTNILKPLFIGASGAFGVSLGYAIFDFASTTGKDWFIKRFLLTEK
mmetsp:Transcript_21890/g.30602  ORF Transcript_21890/g.30602 Transcript_21890/m.30602 type:complete len:113 (-) Transcript_21890:76-414(-)